MSATTFYAPPGYGEEFLASRRYSQAVRVGDRVETSGQGGWDDELNFPESLEDEIVAAFDNVMIEQFRKRMGDRAPIWTQTGVATLALPQMRIEIRVVAVVDQTDA
ncbi:hypothetical protein [Mycolicibacterium vaccae]|uniref:hypothetical protein n=1 Tax=Mycolicibacterium vaccae TaxID=1810 RepID=UPI003D01234B